MKLPSLNKLKLFTHLEIKDQKVPERTRSFFTSYFLLLNITWSAFLSFSSVNGSFSSNVSNKNVAAPLSKNVLPI